MYDCVEVDVEVENKKNGSFSPMKVLSYVWNPSLNSQLHGSWDYNQFVKAHLEIYLSEIRNN